MTTLTITLPHTPRELSPNAKTPLTQRGAVVAGYKKTAAKSRARNIAWGRTCEALNGRRMQPTHYRVVWFSRDRSRTRIIAWRAARRIWMELARPWGLTTGRWIAPGLSGFTTWDAPDKWKSCLKGGRMNTRALRKRALARYLGGKNRIAPWIISFFRRTKSTLNPLVVPVRCC